MSLQIIQSKAEEAFIARFENEPSLAPTFGRITELREYAVAQFMTNGLPHRRVEAWKYTDLRTHLAEAFPPAERDEAPLTKEELLEALGPLRNLDCHLIAFVNGTFRLKRALDKDVVAPLSRVVADDPTWLAHRLVQDNTPQDDSTIALNTVLAREGAVLKIGGTSGRGRLRKPVHIVFITRGTTPKTVMARNLIDVAPDTKATIIESHVTIGGAAAAQNHVTTELRIGAGANVRHIKLHRDGEATLHLGNWVVDAARNTVYRAFHLAAGVGITRNQIFLRFTGEGANCHLSGATLLRNRQHCDTTLVVDHAVPGCESREHYKYVLADEARGVFQGKVIVARDAQKTDGKQMAQALLLSQAAEFDSKPELEIYADDVVCGHGSTAGELDEDMLFYLRSRGVPDGEARQLLTEAFVGEVLDYVDDEKLRNMLGEIASGWLAGN